jgi:hypothetical protein
VACPPFFRRPLPSVSRLLRLLGGKRPPRGRCLTRPRLEVLEDRILPTTYTLPLVNQTGLDPSKETVYVAGFSTASQMELQANGTWGAFPSSSGTIPSYDISTLKSITLNSATPLIGARLYFFVAPPGQAPSLSYSGNGSSVIQPTNPPNSNYPPFDIVEITQPPSGSQPTIDVQTVDGFIFPLTLTLNGGGQVGQPNPNANVNRLAILNAYQPFMQNQPNGTGDPYLPLLFAPNSIAGQAGGIVNPGRYIADGMNPGSPLNTVWTSTLTTLFQTPNRTISMIGDDGAYYKGTPMQVGPDWVLHFVGSTDPNGNNPNGNVFNIYSPLTRDPAGQYQANESAGEMVFANDGVFNDVSSNVILGRSSNQQVSSESVATGLERDLAAALNRGVALQGPTDGVNGDSSTYWGTETNWYPAGQTENLFSLFMHTATVGGTNIFALPPGAVNDAQNAKMASAYGFAFDETPTHGPTGQPNVPSKFDPVPAGTNTITIALGPWLQPAFQAPPPSTPAPTSTSAGSTPPGLSQMQLAEAAVEAFFAAEGILTHKPFLVGVGLSGSFLETSGLPANVGSQLQTTLLQDGFLDLILLNRNGRP